MQKEAAKQTQMTGSAKLKAVEICVSEKDKKNLKKRRQEIEDIEYENFKRIIEKVLGDEK